MQKPLSNSSSASGDGRALQVRSLAADELDAVAPAWDACVAAARRPSPFLLARYVAAWSRAFASPDRARLLAATRGDTIVGVLPLVIRRRGPLRVLEVVGGYEATPADIALVPGEPAATAAALVEAVLAAGGFDHAHLAGLPRGAIACSTDRRLAWVERIDAPVMDVTADWDATLEAHLSRSSRKSHRRRRRRLEEAGALTIDVVRDPERLPAALDEAFVVHGRRWHGEPDGSTFGTDSGRAFHRGVVAALGADGVAVLAIVRLDGRAIAFQYAFLVAGALYCFRVAHDPDLARYSPGTIAMLAAIEAACASGATRVELLGGGESYKLEIADRTEPLGDGIGWARTPQGAVGVVVLRGTIAARRLLKRSEHLRRLRGRLHRGTQGTTTPDVEAV